MQNILTSTTPLFDRFHVSSPEWYLTDDSNALNLKVLSGVVTESIVLTSAQAKAIRNLAGAPELVDLEIKVNGKLIQATLIGQRVGDTWTGLIGEKGDKAATDMFNRKVKFPDEPIVSRTSHLKLVK